MTSFRSPCGQCTRAPVPSWRTNSGKGQPLPGIPASTARPQKACLLAMAKPRWSLLCPALRWLATYYKQRRARPTSSPDKVRLRLRETERITGLFVLGPPPSSEGRFFPLPGLRGSKRRNGETRPCAARRARLQRTGDPAKDTRPGDQTS